jgi:hypothetical protein
LRYTKLFHNKLSLRAFSCTRRAEQNDAHKLPLIKYKTATTVTFSVV